MDLISSIKISSVSEAEQILKAAGTEGDLFEKAHKVGDEKVYQGVTYYVAGFNAKGVPLWRKKKEGGGGSGGTMTSTPKSSTSKPSTPASLSSIKEKALKVPGVTVFEEVTSTNGAKGIKVGTKTSHTTYWYDDFKGENGALELQMDAKTLSRLERKHDENVRLSKVKSTNDFWEYLKSIGEADPKRGIAGYDIKGYIKQAKQDLINEKYLRDVTIPVVKFIVKENSKASKPKNQKEAAIADLTKDFEYRSSNLKISDYITGTRRKSGLWVTVDTAKMSTNEKKEFERIRGQLDGGKYRFEPNGVYEYWIQKKV